MTAPLIVLVLKIAVIAVTVLLIASVCAIIAGRKKLHGWLNTAFFILTMAAVIGLEVVVRILWPSVSAEFFDVSGPYRSPLITHLCFSVPAAVVLPFMMYTGRLHRSRTHRSLSMVFVLLWVGTFITGVFYLPHVNPTQPNASFAQAK